MRYLLVLAPVLALAGHLQGGDPVWKTKPATQWAEDDARQILAASPWAKKVTAIVTRRLTEDQLREGGQMGQPRGVGNDGVDPKGTGPKISPNVFSGPGGDDRSPRSLPQPIALNIRWESALPVQLAESKVNDLEPPTLGGDGYRIAIYGVPGSGFRGDPVQLGDPLKKFAALKREGKKDVRPIRVEVFQREEGLVVVYLFPLSAELSVRDQRVLFEARIGRIMISQAFELAEMQFAGKLEL